MRLRVQFGLIDRKDVSWWRRVEDFPKIVNFLGRNYEWVMYDRDPAGKVDYIFTFSELPNYDPNYNVLCPVWKDMFPEASSDCECGARYTSFPWDHLRMCKLWTKW